MLRMGFIDDVEWILEHTPATRQTALFSATMPDPIRRIAQRYLREPQQVKIRAATTTVATIKQKYWQVRGADKLEALTRMLEVEEDFDAAIIFVRTKLATVELADKLEARGYAAAALSGDLTQGLREQVIERLKSGSLDIVVATDVAARGIDVPRVSHVINYDVPYDTEAYVHRIGRTGRAGRTGVAILFVAPREMRMLKAIERATRQLIEPIALPTRGEVAERRVAQFKQQIMDVLAEENLDFFFEVVRRMESEENLATRQIAAALAFLAQRERPLQPEGADVPAMPERAFERPARAESFERKERPEWKTRGERPEGTERAERPEWKERQERPEFKERGERSERKERPEFKERGERPASRDFGNAPLVRYRIEVGREQGALPKEIVGAIANEGGIDGRQIGQINLFDDYSTVELPELPPDVLDILKRTRVRQLPLKIRVAAPGEGDKPRFGKSQRPAGSAGASSGRAEFSPRPKRDFKGGGEFPARADREFKSGPGHAAHPWRDSKDAGGGNRPKREAGEASAKPPYRGEKKTTGDWKSKSAGKFTDKPAGKKRY
jgi:ATP-dependent RNA helicase DeaD